MLMFLATPHIVNGKLLESNSADNEHLAIDWEGSLQYIYG